VAPPAVTLTPTSYVVLGCVGRLGRCTSYEMKSFVAGSVGYFWTFPHSQLYAEPARLAAAGLLAEEREETGRRRRTYQLTPAGRQALAAWLAAPSASLTEIRDLPLLKLFFGALGDRDDARRTAEEAAAAHQERLAVYGHIAAGPARDDSYARAALELGLRYEAAATAFWEEMAEDPPA
jgi:DNA-binding PadR family transcriptional regulator